MANSIIPATPSITGVVSTAVTLAAGSTLTVYASTAQSFLDFKKLVLCFQSASSTLSSIEFVAGDNFSMIGQALPSAIAIPTDESVIAVGGKLFESARFQNSDSKLEIYNTGNSILCTAYLLP